MNTSRIQCRSSAYRLESLLRAIMYYPAQNRGFLKKMLSLRKWIFLFVLSVLLQSSVLFAESQGNDYKGVTDPFGDPANYEFAEDEKEDKEFFHLGRYIMIGIDVGAGIFTGGLGRSNTPGFMVGGRLLYFFDKAFAMEASIHYGNHTDTLSGSDGSIAKIDTNMIPILFGFRYYFDTKNAPKAIAIANPYLVAGGGLYMRSQNVIADNNFGFQASGNTSSTTNAFGGFLGGGAEFNVYRKHIYLGADFRYHFVFFPDEDATYSRKLAEGDRSGDYFTSFLTITYNF
jgi:hypothetical protein